MTHHFPIWNKVTACNYKSSKSWGSKDCAALDQYVGSSKSNSHLFAVMHTTRRAMRIDGQDVISFRLSIDGRPIKQAIFTDNNGRAGDLIKMEDLTTATT